MAADRSRVRPGMDVVGPDGVYIGSVADVTDEHVVVTRPETSTIYVPLDAVTGSDEQQVALNVSASDIDLQNWPHEGSFVGAVSTRPGPQGPGMPSGQPGWPTFEGTGRPYEPGPGAGNLVDDTDAGTLQTPSPHLPGAGSTGVAGLSPQELDVDANQPGVDPEETQGP